MRVVVGALFALAAASGAAAQESELTVYAGVKLWNTRWTSFEYATATTGSRVLAQVDHESKVVLLPLVSVRWGPWLASMAAYDKTRHREVGRPSGGQREEFDANVGYAVLPGAAVTLGYKKVRQGDYKLAGPVLGFTASAPLGGAVSAYTSFALGRFDTTGTVSYDSADYRLLEAGLAYTLAVPRWAKSVSVTAGWRSQVLVTKDALASGNGARDARDLTEGFTLGVITAF